MKANKNQEKAIKTIDKNLLVNAGAGTGKTRVLVSRYIEILERGDLPKGREIESIVAITFTKKAAEEMKERIRAELQERLDDGRYWQELYRDIDRANISTIHSFASNILKENPIEAEIDPLFRILEDYEAKKLLKSTIEKVLASYLEDDDVFYKMMVDLDQSSISPMVEDLYKVYNDILTTGEDIDILADKLDATLAGVRLDEDYINSIELDILELKSRMAKNAKIHRLESDQVWEKFKNRDFKDDQDLIDSLNYFKDFLGNSKKHEELIDQINRKISRASISMEEENRPYYELIIKILSSVRENYEAEKKLKSALDYDDLQIKTLKLLEDDRILSSYQEKYRYIMIDEFQDTNELQKEIFYRLASRNKPLDLNNLFVVGDPKQSIYGFRGADLDVFYKVREDMESLGEENLISLEENYRTFSNIMEFINQSFHKIMGDKYDHLRPNIPSKRDLEIEVLENDQLEIPEGQAPTEYSRYYEADLIAKRIRSLVDSGDYNYEDIALLFRAGSKNYIYEEALENYAIPYYNTGGKGFFEREEVRDSINGLKAIHNQEDKISNLALVRSSMIGLSDHTIYKILKEGDSVYRSMKKLLDSGVSKDEDRIRMAISLYDHLFMIRDQYGASKVLEELIDKTLYKQLILLREDAKQSLSNLNKLISYFKEYDRRKVLEGIDLLDYIDELEIRDEGQAMVESEDSNVVKIMTIHKSKGLEFPVVIIPELSRGEVNPSYNIAYDKKLGLGLNIADNKGIYDEISNDRSSREFEESKRVLYVAMTRARELLILGAQGRNSGFKKLIKEHLDLEYCKFISSIDLEVSRKDGIELIDSKYFEPADGEEPESLYEEDMDSFPRVESTSISQFMDFKKCPRAYFLKHRMDFKLDYLDSLEEEEVRGEESYLSAIEKGNIVHKFTEEYLEGKTDSEELLRGIIDDYNLDYESSKKEVSRYIENFIRINKDTYDKIYREEEFAYHVNDLVIRGFIDRINISDSYCEILDYKTNRLVNKSSLVENYSVQLQFYSLLVEKLLSRKPDSAKIVFLENAEEVEVDLGQESMDRLEEEIDYFTSFINKKRRLEDYQGHKNCNKTCEYSSICKGSYFLAR